MSQKQETVFIGAVHKYLPPGRVNPYWMKNSNTYTAGIWDCWYSGTAADLWIEYKFIMLPKRGDTLILPNLSALQLDWGRQRRKEGRNVVVIVGCKEGGVIFENLEWETEITADAFKARIQSREQVADWIIANVQRTIPAKRR